MIFICGIVFSFFLLLFHPEMRDSIIIDYIFYGSFVLWLISILVRIIDKFIKKISHTITPKIPYRKRKQNPATYSDKINAGSIVLSDAGIDYMSGSQFEEWCERFLISVGAKNVQRTVGSGDQGVDIIAELDGIKYAIQCKCYSKPIGNKPVQEVYAGIQYYHCLAGAVMTNQRFTSGGRSLATNTGVELWDRDWIIEQISRLWQIEKEEIQPSIQEKAKIYGESVESEMESGLWPHQYAAEIDLAYFKELPQIRPPGFDVTGIARFPGVDPHKINRDSIIVLETNPFDSQEDAERFARYAEKHFYAKTWVEKRDEKYFAVIQTHVYSIQSYYWEDDGAYHL